MTKSALKVRHPHIVARKGYIRPLLAETLRQRGFDARHVDDLKRSGLSDPEQLRSSGATGRVSAVPRSASRSRGRLQSWDALTGCHPKPSLPPDLARLLPIEMW